MTDIKENLSKKNKQIHGSTNAVLAEFGIFWPIFQNEMGFVKKKMAECVEIREAVNIAEDLYRIDTIKQNFKKYTMELTKK